MEPSVPPVRSQLGLLCLPVELRFHIYRHCLHRGKREPSIYAWYKGAGQKQGDCYIMDLFFCKYSGRQTSPNMDGFVIYASHKFPPALLQLNQALYAEAREELYGYIHFRVEARFPRFHLPILGYWLTKHPMAFSKHISLTMDFAVNPSRQLKREFEYKSHREVLSMGHTSYLSTADMQRLASLLGSMPNLEEVTLILCLDCCGGFDSRALLMDHICLQDPLYIGRLKTFEEALHPGRKSHHGKQVRLRLVVSCSEWWLGYSKMEAKEKIVERLALEGFDVELAKDAQCGVSRLSWGI